MEKTDLLSMDIQALQQLMSSLGQPLFRAKQLFSWLHKGVTLEEMRNLPAALRSELDKTCLTNPVRIIDERISRLDGTRKFLYALQDGNLIEGVLMQYHYGNTLCLSTQVGCRMGCRFCASTLEGCLRSLTPGEMLGQILCANAKLAETDRNARVGNVVLMGSGEPFDNYDNVVQFLRILNHPDGICIGMRSVSLSTCGLVPEIKRLAGEKLPVTLSLSLHAPTDEIRRTLMPIANRYSIDEVLDACRLYVKETGRRVIFEYALIHDVNSLPEHARLLAGRLRHLQCHVNLIPLNSVPERGLKGVSESEIARFKHVLEEEGISVTRRREMGDDIEGACGQLRRHYMKQTDKPHANEEVPE
ncbi:MAG: 23S rRNA (adenine(2503)-C(2))-methyltransferase RlmN [Clostridia bacterium]|nr:23S rRNA (adenine(2503)-C(2))-methyltransferase RlmN [Clostridia bacterium]